MTNESEIDAVGPPAENVEARDTEPATSDDTETHEETLARLADLKKPDYESVRIAEAKTLGWRVSILDEMVSEKRRAAPTSEAATEQTEPPQADEAPDAPAAGEPENPIAHAIHDAEEISDPLDGLVERAIKNPAEPFAPETMDAIVALKKNDRAAFEALRKSLKDAGVRMTGFSEFLKEAGGGAAPEPTQADILVDLAAGAALFRSADGTAFADLTVDDHRETWPVRTKGFKRWLARQYFEQTGGAPSSEALQAALNVIESRAFFDAPELPVFVRVGGLDDKLYLDLGDEAWRAVEIDATGWRIVDEPPVRFRRAAGMKPLPVPAPGGSVETLRSFLNVQSDSDFVLVVTWALAVLRNRGPYPVIVLAGEQGSAKSTFSAILRSLLDPNTAPLRALPREDRDLFIAASNGHLLAFDNISNLPNWISDTLCRLATGGGFAVRQLYSDMDEVLFDAARPVILNGIENIVVRPDLADRALFLTLEPIAEEARRPEAELWRAFESERPKILGALLDAVAHGLTRLPDTVLPRLPRMADFAVWATACETALWPAGTFWSAYCENRNEAVESVLDADPVAAAVRTMMAEAQRTVWTGTASDLLGVLEEAAGERIAKAKTWPDSPRALAGRLRRAASFLRKVGIKVSFEREGRARTRVIRITAAATDPADDPRTVASGADGRPNWAAETVRSNSLKTTDWNAADGADANSPLQSTPEQADGADANALPPLAQRHPKIGEWGGII